MPLADDLCPTCQDSEDEKMQRLQTAEAHLQCAKKQQNYYRQQVKLSKEHVKKLAENPVDSTSLSISLTYSFDHAQQVHYPSNPQQPSPLLFKTTRNVGFLVFALRGVTCPKPTVQKRSHNHDDDEGPPPKRLCSYCRMAGHTKTKKGVVTCPKLLQESA